MALLTAVPPTEIGPLKDLVEKTKLDPGMPFDPDVISALVALKKNSLAQFEKLRAELKGAKCRVSILDAEIAEESGDDAIGAPKQADILIGLAEEAGLFHAPDRTGYADLHVNGHRETCAIRSKQFKRWLARAFYEGTGGAANSEAYQSALSVIEAKADFDGPEREVFIRVGGLAGKQYLDLGDDTWQVVEVDAVGWRIISDPPIRFRRTSGMQPLPVPVSGGSINTLRNYLNVKEGHNFILVVAWLLAVLRNKGPYPALVLSGEQGSAKSTFSSGIRSLIDPNTAPLRALPRDDRDLFIAANNGHVLAFDNVSNLQPWISDTLCRLATGGGFATRQLFTDQDEILFEAARPIILNGIEDIVTRPDLADRAIFLTLEPIPEDKRKPEKEIWAGLDKARPQLLGTLLNAVSVGLKRLPSTKLESLPRMADFALWATACETELWGDGTFIEAYAGNRAEAIDSVIDADPVASAIRAMMAEIAKKEGPAEWKGIASGLLEALEKTVTEKVARNKAWPQSARALSGRVRRAAPFLRKVNIEIAHVREGKTGARQIHITGIPPALEPDKGGEFVSASSANRESHEKSPESSHILADAKLTQNPEADANDALADAGEISYRQRRSLKNGAITTADDADANIPTQSASWTGAI